METETLLVRMDSGELNGEGTLSLRSCNSLRTSHKYMNASPVNLCFSLSAISRYITNELEKTVLADYSIIIEADESGKQSDELSRQKCTTNSR